MKSITPTPRTFRGLPAIALALAALGLSEPAAQAQTTFTQTNLNSSAGATGSEIANDGTLVRAYHFGGSGITDVTVNGVTFTAGGGGSSGTDSAMTGSWDDGWGPGWGGFGATGDYGQLISAMTAAQHATGTAVSTITVSGLTVGHEYRVQLISNKPREGVIDVEGTTGAFTVGDTEAATMLTATWVAGDDTLNLGFVNQNHPDGPHFCGYALHDITPVAADAATSTVTASPTTVASDGVTASTVTVTLNNASNIPVPGKDVSLAKFSGLGSPTIEPISGTTNGSGIATFTVTCDTANIYQFEATDTTDTVTVAEKASVTFSASAVSLANSTVTAAPPSVVANGTSTSTITVTLKDATGTGASDKTVALAKTSGPGSPAIAPASATTNGSGIATFTVKSTTVGSCVFTATDTTDSLPITATATVDFTSSGVVADANSTVEVSPASVPADGTTASTITVTLKDPYGNPVPDEDVSLAQFSGLGSPVIDPASAVTDASGVAIFTVTSTTAGACVFTATGGSVTLTQTADVTFGPSALDSTVTASLSPLPADGTTTSTITVTLLDADLNPVEGKDVSLVSSRGDTDTIADASGPSDEFGVVTFTVSSTTAGSPAFTATDTTDGITIGTAGVTFEAGSVVAGNSTVTASPTTVAADGVATSTITVTLNDAYNNPVPGKDVSLATTSGPVIDPASATTDASGVATFTVTSTTAGDYVFTATVDSVPITDTTTVTFAQPTATITWGPATDVTLPPGASGVLSADTTGFVDTDVKTNGMFVAAVCNGTAGTVNGVTFTGRSSFTDSRYLTFGTSAISMDYGTGGGNVNNGYSNFGYSDGTTMPLLINGGGQSSGTGTITLGSLTAGKQYQIQIWATTWDNIFSMTVGGVALRVGEPQWWNMNPNHGNVPYYVPQYVVGTFTATGTSQPISWSGGYTPSAISLRDVTAAPAIAANSTVTASPTTVSNDGVTTSTITVTLKDASNNPALGKTVTLASDRSTDDTISPASGPSDASGVVTFTVQSATAGTAVFTATDVTDSDLVIAPSTASVTFSTSAVSLANSTVVAAPPAVAANGTATSTITVTLKNVNGTGVSGKAVSLAMTSGPGSPDIATVSGTTDGSGIATFTVASTTVGACDFTATDTTDGLTLGTTGVTFEAWAVDADISTVIASPTTVAADGSATSTITVTLQDASSNPIAGKAVSLAKFSGPGSPVIATVSGTTDASGEASFTVASTTVGVCVFTATGDSVALNQTASVTFTSLTMNETPLAMADDSTGAEIAYDGTLVRAYHFGDPADERYTAVSVNGIPFAKGVSSIDWDNGIITYLDPDMSGFNGGTTFSGVFSSITDDGYRQLVDSFIWAAGDSPDNNLTFTPESSGGILKTGHGYRLQLIMGNASNAQLTVGGMPYTFTTGDVNSDGAPPAMLTATWTADGSPFSVVWTALDGGAFSGYVLHDLTGGAPSATITATGSPLTTLLTTTYGTASTATSFSVSGAGMTAGITVTPPLGFEVSTTSDFTSNVGNNSSPITVGSSGTIASTPVHVRLAANAPVAGAYDAQNIVLSSAGATSVNVTTAASGNTVSRASSSVTATGTTTFPYNRSPQGPASADVTGSTGITSYSYEGTGTTTYAASPTQPTNAGTYAVTATVAEDANYHTASSTPLGFTITPNFASWIDFYTSIPLLDRDPGDDPDQDGQTNEDEYAFGLIPNNGASSSPISVQLNKTTGKFTYTRRNPELTGIVYSILTSTTLAVGVQPGDWAIDATATQTPSGGGELQTVEVTLGGTKPLGATKLFVRVMAVVPAQ